MTDTRGRLNSKLWRYLSYGIAGFVLAPVIIIFASWLLPISSEHWEHLSQYILKDVLIHTLALLFGVGLLSAVFGTISAWVCSQYIFPGVRFFRRALLFPFAVPAYVNAFVYVGLLDYAGPLRSFIRSVFGSDTWFPEVRSLEGAMVLMSLSLYPYVFALSYNAFQSQGRNLGEAARSLGHNSLSIFKNLALPYARPWIIGGMCLVGLEVLNDFGTVSVVGVQTFTTAIYKSWFAFFSPETAAQLSSLLILIAFAVYSWDQYSRRKRDYKSSFQAIHLTPLPRLKGALASLFCFSLFGLGFLVPLLQVAFWSFLYAEDFLAPELLLSLKNSLLLGLTAALLTTLSATILVFAKRTFASRSISLAYRFAQMGYGIPGSVIAVGVFLPLAWVDRAFVDILEKFGYEGGLILTGSIFGMSLALAIRFLAVTSSSLETGMSRIPQSFDEAAGLYGVRGFALFHTIYWPLLKGSFGAGFLLAFVDIIKEMPLTLITRPFGWDTLSVRIYSFISEGEWEKASVPALALIAIGILPLLLFSGKKHESQG